MSETATPTPTGRLKVFISYSRKDRAFADELLVALETCGFEAYLDRQDIAPGEVWEARLTSLIREADTVVYVVSPASVTSQHCSWEVAETQRMAKRLIPVVSAPVEDDSAPPSLKRLNYIYFDKPNSFGGSLAELARALNLDLDWLRDHTHLLEEATRWDGHGRPEALLLRSSALDEAKVWQARRPKHAPEPTALQLDFISASVDAEEKRNSRERQQVAEMALANDAREKALRKAEDTLKEMAEVLRRRARARAIAGAIMIALSAAAIVFGVRAEQQRRLAVENVRVAQDIVDSATGVFAKYQEQFDIDAKKAVFNVFLTAAKTAQPRAMNNLGVSYSQGLGTDVDLRLAQVWFEKAAALGDANAMTNLGIIAATATAPKQPDYADARRRFEEAIQKGNARAMMHLGILYGEGHGVTKDEARALELIERAAKSGEPIAMNQLGFMYSDGKGVKPDFAKAKEWFERAATLGNTTSLINLASLYMTGRGVEPNPEKARELVEQAAARNNLDALTKLARIYETGIGGNADPKRAKEYFRKASLLGSKDAEYELRRVEVKEVAVAGRHREAMELQEALARNVELEETAAGRPGRLTKTALTTLAWYAVLAQDPGKALSTGERAKELFPESSLPMEMNRAHALMLLGREAEAAAIYRAHRGKSVPELTNEVWEDLMRSDFAELEKAGLSRPLMAALLAELDPSPSGQGAQP